MRRNEKNSVFWNEAIAVELMFADLFYRHPLIQDADKDITLLIFGMGRYGRAAFDLALSVGQSARRRLRIAVVAKDGLDELSKQMPLLDYHTRLVRYGGFRTWRDNLPKSKLADIILDDTEIDESNIVETVKRYDPDYVIACFADKSNRLVCEHISLYFPRIFIGFVQRRFFHDVITSERCVPVYKPAKLSDIDRQLYDLAFGLYRSRIKALAHIVPENNLSDNFSKNPRIYKENIIFALHIKYKLSDLGADISKPEDAATLLSQLLAPTPIKSLSRQNSDRIDELVWAEHRRRLAKMITDGFTAADDLDYPEDTRSIIYRSQNDDGSPLLRHPAAVKARALKRIPDEFDWENGDLTGFDELDCASVRLHRALGCLLSEHGAKHADRAALIVTRLYTAVDSVLRAKDVIDEVKNAAELVLSHDRTAAERFSYTISRAGILLSRILNEKSLSDSKKLLSELSSELFLHIEYLKKRDFKAGCYELIESIPQALKFKPGLTLLQSFTLSGERNSDHAAVNAVRLGAKCVVWFEKLECDPLFSVRPPEVRLAGFIEDLAFLLSFFRERSCVSECRLVIDVNDCSDPKKKQLKTLCRRYCSDFGVPSDAVTLEFKKHSGENILVKTVKQLSGKTLVNGFCEGSSEYEAIDALNNIRPIKEYKDFIRDDIPMLEDRLILCGISHDSFKRCVGSDIYLRIWGLYSAKHQYEDVSSEDVWQELCDGLRLDGGFELPEDIGENAVTLADRLALLGYTEKTAPLKYGFLRNDIKELLTDENAVFRLFLYHTLRNSSDFDDVLLLGDGSCAAALCKGRVMMIYMKDSETADKLCKSLCALPVAIELNNKTAYCSGDGIYTIRRKEFTAINQTYNADDIFTCTDKTAAREEKLLADALAALI